MMLFLLFAVITIRVIFVVGYLVSAVVVVVLDVDIADVVVVDVSLFLC